MSRFLFITLVSLTLITAVGCKSGRSRGIGGPPPTADSGMPPMGDAEVPEPDSSMEEDASVDTSTPPPPPTCETGFTECGGMCVDTDYDDYHCGGCDIVCGSGAYCEGGECIEEGPTCPSPRMMCGDSCVDTATNRSHCGSCFNTCASDEACRSGSCVSTCVPSCGGAECGPDGCGGSCGSCVSGEMCVSGYCEAPPPPPTGAGESCSTASAIVGSASFTFGSHVANHTPFSCGTSSSRPDVAYAYTALFGGTVTITATGSSGADTMLAVYDSSSCTSSYEVACNDDSPTTGGLDSEVSFTATAFATYYIVVAPYSSTTPTDTITVTVTEGS
jgi:hypothetical protein